jgi:ribosomal-protein-serine acetyltransferase
VSAELTLALADGRCLRPLQEADADELHALIERNRAELARWMQWAQEQAPADTLAFIKRSLAREADNRALQRAIVADERIVGVLGLREIDWANRCAEISYWLDERHQGQGIMTSALAALVRHAFDEQRLNRLEIRADVENAPSRALAERLGFRYEGTLRQAYRVTATRYSDDAVYSMLAADRSQPGARLDESR